MGRGRKGSRFIRGLLLGQCCTLQTGWSCPQKSIMMKNSGPGASPKTQGGVPGCPIHQLSAFSFFQGICFLIKKKKKSTKNIYFISPRWVLSEILHIKFRKGAWNTVLDNNISCMCYLFKPLQSQVYTCVYKYVCAYVCVLYVCICSGHICVYIARACIYLNTPLHLSPYCLTSNPPHSSWSL